MCVRKGIKKIELLNKSRMEVKTQPKFTFKFSFQIDILCNYQRNKYSFWIILKTEFFWEGKKLPRMHCWDNYNKHFNAVFSKLTAYVNTLEHVLKMQIPGPLLESLTQ